MSPKPKKEAAFDGALIIDKPAGMTSHDVVSRLRRILNTKKIGHTGTLDPFATGVLVMLVGKATRLARFLDKDEKRYEAVVNFGFETETGDKEGKRKKEKGKNEEEGEDGEMDNAQWTMDNLGSESHELEPSDPANSEIQPSVPSVLSDLPESSVQSELSDPSGPSVPSKDELVELVNGVIPSFTGEIEQVPPMYSAKKVKGKKLYELARAGIEIERAPVAVRIKHLAVLDNITPHVYSETPETLPNEVVLDVTCSAGTYIRTLAEDIGRRIGVECHLTGLRRTKAGIFGLENAITLEELEQLAATDSHTAKVVSMTDVTGHLPLQKLDDQEVELISRGMKINAKIESDSVREIRLTDAMDELVAIGQTDSSGMIQPRIVFKN